MDQQGELESMVKKLPPPKEPLSTKLRRKKRRDEMTDEEKAVADKEEQDTKYRGGTTLYQKIKAGMGWGAGK